ncbi:MAG: TldD/PmbA family protein [Candidatus Micrarchaeaceae archaeon]
MIEIAEKIVKYAVAQKFDEAVAEVYESRRRYLKIANSKIDSIVDKNSLSANLFLTSRKRVLFLSIKKLGDSEIVGSIKKAKAIIAKMKAKEDYNGIAAGPFKYRENPGYDKKILDYSYEDMKDIAEAAINDAVSHGASNVSGTLLIGYAKLSLATSKHVAESETGTFSRLTLRISKNGLSFQDFLASRYINEIRRQSIAKEGARFIDGLATGRIKAGRYDAIYMPSPAGLLLSNVNAMACIGNIETGSFLSGKIGKEIANKNISIYDDGRAKSGINSSAFDDEGFPTQKTKLVENGILKSYLHNYSTAVKYNTRSTGNAGLVEPSPNTLVFSHRKRVSLDKLVSNVDNGILLSSTWYTRFSNYLSGDFSTVPRDLAIYIKNGEPRFAIKAAYAKSMLGIRISDNIIRMLKNIDYASTRLRQSTSWDSEGSYYFVPDILVRDVKVTVA